MARSATIRTVLSVGVLLGSALASPAASAQTSGTWATTGSMTRARLYDTATVLQNGQVLAVLSVAASPLSVSPATHPGSAASWLRYHAHASNNAVIAEPGWCPVTWRSRPDRDSLLGVSVVGAPVYAVGASAAHAVYAFNRANGQLLWTRVLDNIVMTQPLVAGNRIVVGSGNTYMRANPVRDWRTVIRGTGCNAIYALNAATGAVLWRWPVVGEAMPTPVYRDGLLYWVTGDRRFLAIDAATGQMWLFYAAFVS